MLVHLSISADPPGAARLGNAGRRAPIVGADRGAIPEYGHPEPNDLLFAAGTACALRTRIVRVIQELELIARLSGNVQPLKLMDDEVREAVGGYQDVTRLSETRAAR